PSILTYISNIYVLSLHDALPIYVLLVTAFLRGKALLQASISIFISASAVCSSSVIVKLSFSCGALWMCVSKLSQCAGSDVLYDRSEEHTSELQSRENIVCRLLLE